MSIEQSACTGNYSLSQGFDAQRIRILMDSGAVRHQI